VQVQSVHGASAGHSREDFDPAIVRGQAVSLMRGLITMCATLKPLPTSRIIDIEMEYYSDITPPSYQPQHFREATTTTTASRRTSSLARDGYVISVGSFDTPFHGLKLKICCEERTLGNKLVQEVGVSPLESRATRLLVVSRGWDDGEPIGACAKAEPVHLP
jgi:hypothetical protein